MASMSTCLDNPLKDDDEDEEGNVDSREQQRCCNGKDNADYETPSSSSEFRKESGNLGKEAYKNHDTTATAVGVPVEDIDNGVHSSSDVRSRRRSNKHAERQSKGDKPKQRSNVPCSSATTSSPHLRRDVDEQLSRLKSTCHYALVSFLLDCPSLTNNNVKGNQTKGTAEAASKVHELKKVKSTEKGEGIQVTSSSASNILLETMKINNNFFQTSVNMFRNGRTNSSLWLSLYKFLNLVLTIVFMFLKVVFIFFIVIFILYCLMVLHKPTQALLSRHTQDLIYPFMRTIRFGSLPFVGRFPQLHELYEDACVLANPFFEMNDVSCWPCESVRHVIDLTGFSNFTSGYYHSGIPFIVKDAFAQKVSIDELYKLYEKDHKLMGNVILQSSHEEIQTFDDLVRRRIKTGNFMSGALHAEWKINRVQYARQLRKYFSRPYYIPNSTEISVQHFLYIDEPAAEQYALPVTEFANVFVMQADGQRLIVLVPVRHCRAACKAISVVLQPNDVLFYNWLFWRPISFPMRSLGEAKELSITYVGSFY